jgi:hypothetical protein
MDLDLPSDKNASEMKPEKTLIYIGRGDNELPFVRFFSTKHERVGTIRGLPHMTLIRVNSKECEK